MVWSSKAGAFAYLAKRGEAGERELLLMHIERALLYRASVKLASSDYYDHVTDVISKLEEVQSTLKLLTSQLKGIADLRARLPEQIRGARGDRD